MRSVSLRDTSVIFFVVLWSILYTLPNVYPEYPSLEIKADPEKITEITKVLASHNITPNKVVKIDDPWLSFTNTDIQMQAKLIIEEKFPETLPSLNLKRSLPNWLTSLSAKPMKLGLDLRGGVHLLLEVEVEQIKQKILEQRLSSIANYINANKFEIINLEENKAKIYYQPSDFYHIQNELSKMQVQILANSENESVITVPMRENDYSESVNSAVTQTIKSLDKRINELGIAEASVSKQGSNFISIDLPGIQDISRAKSLLGKTATLRFHILADAQTPANAETKEISMRNMGKMSVEKIPVLSGDSIIFARAGRDEHSGVIVHIGIDSSKEKEFYNSTASNVGRRMAVVYIENQQNGQDTESIISAPTVQSGLGSQFQITGMQSYREAQDLAMLLRSGALAAPVKIVEESIIGPSLGEDNIYKGISSLLAASSLVFLFMIVYYRTYGLVANIALFVNILLIIASLSIMDATLTLPGIAGIVLTVGMAVDANILINERIREEIRSGENLHKSIALGFNRAFDTIFDSNMSTLLVALILFGMGSGSIKGFAITLTIGILASLFTSVFLTKYILKIIAKNKDKLSCGFDFFNHNSSIRFMKFKNKAFLLSSFLLLISIITIFMNGIKLGLDFTGGVEMRLNSDTAISVENLREDFKKMGFDGASVQTLGGLKQVMVRFPAVNLSTKEVNALISENIKYAQLTQIQIIGPQIGSELLNIACWSVLLALLGCTIYIALRFEWRFAISALISLLHDPILIMGMLSLAHIEFNLITLAALLTVMGYSLNDTIVIYDRVREIFQKKREITSEDGIDLSTNQTLSRTLLTSGLTLAVVFCLAIFGGESLQGFSWSLITGIIIGTYSSIYVAGTLAVQFGLKRSHLVKKKIEKQIIVV